MYRRLVTALLSAILLCLQAAPLFASGAVTSPWVWPVNGEVVTSYVKKHHESIEIKADVGTPVLAPEDGKVSWADPNNPFGAEGGITIEHKDDISTTYFAIKDLKVVQGDNVKQGDVIALVGEKDSARYSDLPHLRFAIAQTSTGIHYDPLDFLPALASENTPEPDKDIAGEVPATDNATSPTPAEPTAEGFIADDEPVPNSNPEPQTQQGPSAEQTPDVVTSNTANDSTAEPNEPTTVNPAPETLNEPNNSNSHNQPDGSDINSMYETLEPANNSDQQPSNDSGEAVGQNFFEEESDDLSNLTVTSHPPIQPGAIPGPLRPDQLPGADNIGNASSQTITQQNQNDPPPPENSVGTITTLASTPEANNEAIFRIINQTREKDKNPLQANSFDQNNHGGSNSKQDDKQTVNSDDNNAPPSSSGSSKKSLNGGRLNDSSKASYFKESKPSESILDRFSKNSAEMVFLIIASFVVIMANKNEIKFTNLKFA